MSKEVFKTIEARGTDEIIQRIKELDNLEFLYTIEKTRNLPLIGVFPKPNFIITVYSEESYGDPYEPTPASDEEKTLGKCNRCNINEAVTYGPSGSYAVWCQDCADAYDKDYEEKNPYVKCISCEWGYYMPTGTDATTFKCMSCEFSGK